MTDEEWERGSKERIHILCCSIYHKKGISIAEANGIMGEYADGDYILSHMLDRKYIMRNSDNKFEFTFLGLTEFFRQMLHRSGRQPNEVELCKYVIRESAKASIT